MKIKRKYWSLFVWKLRCVLLYTMQCFFPDYHLVAPPVCLWQILELAFQPGSLFFSGWQMGANPANWWTIACSTALPYLPICFFPLGRRIKGERKKRGENKINKKPPGLTSSSHHHRHHYYSTSKYSQILRARNSGKLKASQPASQPVQPAVQKNSCSRATLKMAKLFGKAMNYYCSSSEGGFFGVFVANVFSPWTNSEMKRKMILHLLFSLFRPMSDN